MNDLNRDVDEKVAGWMERDKYTRDGVPEMVSMFCQKPRSAMSDYELSEWETAFKHASTTAMNNPRIPWQHGKLYGKYLQIVQELRGQLCAA